MFIDSLIHWFNRYALVHIIDSLNHWSFDSLIHLDPLVHWLIHFSIDWLSHWVIDSLICWVIHVLKNPLIHWLTNSLIIWEGAVTAHENPGVKHEPHTLSSNIFFPLQALHWVLPASLGLGQAKRTCCVQKKSQQHCSESAWKCLGYMMATCRIILWPYKKKMAGLWDPWRHYYLFLDRMYIQQTDWQCSRVCVSVEHCWTIVVLESANRAGINSA